MAKFNNSVPISEIPENQKCNIWNMVNNTIVQISLKRFEMLSKNGYKVQGGLGQFSDFMKKNYKIDDYKGSPRTIYHIDSGKAVSCMTNELFDEIKRRNPPAIKIKDAAGNPFEYWKLFLATAKEVREIVNEKSPIEKKVQELEKKIESLTESKAITEPINKEDKIEPNYEPEGEEGDSLEELVTPKKRGRKAKVIE